MTDAFAVMHLSVKIENRTILSDVAFTLPRGAYLAVIGPNGSGKSTLIKCLLGLVAPSSGSVALSDGLRIGYVPQIKTLDRTFPARACDLVASGITGKWPFGIGSEAMDRVKAALEAVGIGKLAFSTLSTMSGGELQRVYLARAVIQEPDLLLLDEPATGIDYTGEEAIHQAVETLKAKNNATVAIATHDLQTARYHASHVVVLRGSQLAFGSPEEAMTDNILRSAFGHAGHVHASEGCSK